MIYDEKYRAPDLPHNITMEGRMRLSISGVRDVDSFDADAVLVNTSQGNMIVRGRDIHMEKLNLENGEVIIGGMINAIEYEEEEPEHEGFFSRLFK